MNMDFPLILVVLTAASGLLWLADGLLLAPRRQCALAQLQSDFPLWEEAGSPHQQEYRRRQRQAGNEPMVVEYAKSLFPVFLLVLLLRSFLVEPFQIPSRSMVPTLDTGDYILVNKYTYGLRLPVVRTRVLAINSPQRGDVMVFFPPHKNDTYFIKRVIGLPGDTVRYTGKKLFVNDIEHPQQLLAQLPPSRPRYEINREQVNGIEHQVRTDLLRPGRDFTVNVKPGHFFMMGDNRDDSQDSRFWGQVRERDIVGKAFAVWMHWDEFFSLPSFQHARWIK